MSGSVRVVIHSDAVFNALKRANGRGVRNALDILAGESKKQVPVDTHALEHSCQVGVDADGKSGYVSYGNDQVGYAIEQHENMEFHHPNGRKAKYLEDPANDPTVQKKMVGAVADAAKEELV